MNRLTLGMIVILIMGVVTVAALSLNRTPEIQTIATEIPQSDGVKLAPGEGTEVEITDEGLQELRYDNLLVNLNSEKAIFISVANQDGKIVEIKAKEVLDMTDEELVLVATFIKLAEVAEYGIEPTAIDLARRLIPERFFLEKEE